MRRIDYTVKFKRDYKRELKGRFGKDLDIQFHVVLSLLRNDSSLPEKYRDHPLKGRWADHRDCHLKPDLVLIYRKPDQQVIELVRLGSHSELEI